MSEEERRNGQREARLQTVVFVGAAVVLAVVLFVAFSAQSNRRAEERVRATIAAALAPTALPTGAGLTSRPGVPTSNAPYPPPAESQLSAVSPLESSPYPMPAYTPSLFQRPAESWIFPHLSAELDPGQFGRPTPGLQALFMGLTAWSTDGQTLRPLLASAWEMSADGLTYTFTLRADLAWVHCDTESWQVERMRPVTADDVVYAIERSLDPVTGSPYAGVLYPIAGAEERHRGDSTASLGVSALNPSTVRFRLARPLEDFPGRLADPLAWPVPREVIEANGEDWVTPGTIWVNGGYCPVIWVPTRVVTGVTNPWLPAEVKEALRELLGPWLEMVVQPVLSPSPTPLP